MLPDEAVAPATPLCPTVQENMVPVTLLVSVIEVVVPEQIPGEAGFAVTVGLGFTVTVTVLGVPLQSLAKGVTVYTAVPGIFPVVDRVWFIEGPLASIAPVTPVCTTVQAKVAPATLLDRAIEVADPEQIACEEGVAITFGLGLTVTITSKGVPMQLLAEGVTV